MSATELAGAVVGLVGLVGLAGGWLCWRWLVGWVPDSDGPLSGCPPEPASATPPHTTTDDDQGERGRNTAGTGRRNTGRTISAGATTVVTTGRSGGQHVAELAETPPRSQVAGDRSQGPDRTGRRPPAGGQSGRLSVPECIQAAAAAAALVLHGDDAVPDRA